MNRSGIRIDRVCGIAIVGLVILSVAAVPSRAQGLSDDVKIHGFGGWAYGVTDGNAYLLGTEDGSWDNAGKGNCGLRRPGPSGSGLISLCHPMNPDCSRAIAAVKRVPELRYPKKQ